jgi:L-aspartate oxidase
MWEDVSIVRSEERLGVARRELDGLVKLPLARSGTASGAMYARQVEFAREVARLIVRCAQRRRESRGLHFTESYPHRDSERFLRDTVLAR